MSKKRRNYSPAFKAKVALVAIRGDKTITQIANQFELHPNQVSKWKKIALDNLEPLFSGNCNAFDKEAEKTIKELHAKIGELTVEKDFFERARSQPVRERKTMITANDELPVARQCRLLEVPEADTLCTGSKSTMKSKSIESAFSV